MSTNFFAQQARARSHTGRLGLLFALGLLTLAVIVHAVVAAGSYYATPPKERPPGINWFDPVLLLISFGIVFGVVATAIVFMVSQLGEGGRSVAMMLGGSEMARTDASLAERRLLNVVEEMSLAAGVPVPPTFVMKNEPAINAFAAGFGPRDAVVVVSAGCLQHLTRDELQGVVAHEFSHIFNGDMRRNLKLFAAIFGLSAMGWVGLQLVRVMGNSKSNSDDKGGGALLLVIGIALLVIGGVGVAFGRLMQAAISRQREYLADATAVQYTRNPEGIGGALLKIGGLDSGSTLRAPKAEGVQHMFFDGASNSFASLLDTHPPLRERVRRVLPNFDGKFPHVAASQRAEDAPEKPKSAAGMPGGFNLPGGLPTVAVLATADAPPNRAAGLRDRVPDKLRRAAAEPFTARSLVFALVLDADHEIRQRQIDAAQRNLMPAERDEMARVFLATRDLEDDLRLPLLDLAAPALRRMSRRQYEEFRATLQALIEADGKMSLFEFALATAVEDQLDGAFGRPENLEFLDSGDLDTDAANILATLARQAGTDADVIGAYSAGRASYAPAGNFPAEPGPALGGEEFRRTLLKFGRGEDAPAAQLMTACRAAVEADGRVVPREAELVRAIGSLLGLPTPHRDVRAS